LLKLRNDPGLHLEFLDESPFERSGEFRELHFFYNGRISALYRGEAVDPYQIPAFHAGGYAYALEKRYASAQETLHRLRGSIVNERVWKKRVRQGGSACKKHMLFLDPAGVDEKDRPVTIHLGTYVSLGRAILAANQLSESWKVRLVVGTVRIVFDGH
jgi:hypothetical protein